MITEVLAIHPHWTSRLILDERTGRLTQQNHGSTGRFARQADVLEVFWDAYPPETFTRAGERFVQTQLLNDSLNGMGGDTLTAAATEARWLTIAGAPVPLVSFLVQAPGTAARVHVRAGTSDGLTFGQIFVQRDYAVPGLPSRPATVVDLGANVGYSAVWFASQYPEARVVAVEPDPDNFRQMTENVRSFGERVTPIEAAIWKVETSLDLHTTDRSGAPLGAWGVQTRPAERGGRQTVRALTVPALMRQCGLRRIDLLKVDVEGAELELFSEGAHAWLEHVNWIIVETHDRFRAGSEAAVRRALSRFRELPRSGENLIFARV